MQNLGMKDKLMGYLCSNKDCRADAGFWNLDAVCRKIQGPFLFTRKSKKQICINQIYDISKQGFLALKAGGLICYADPKVWKKLSYDQPSPAGSLWLFRPQLAKKS
jgi:hypothetical protein